MWKEENSDTFVTEMRLTWYSTQGNPFIQRSKEKPEATNDGHPQGSTGPETADQVLRVFQITHKCIKISSEVTDKLLLIGYSSRETHSLTYKMSTSLS